MDNPKSLLFYQKDLKNIQQLLNETAERFKNIAYNLEQLADYFVPEDENMAVEETEREGELYG